MSHDGPMTDAGQQVTTEIRPEGGVVVGDDGSDCAATAVRAAAEEAVRRGLTLHVIRAWSLMSATRPADLPRGVVGSLPEYEAATLEAERARVDRILGQEPRAAVEVHVAHAAAANALLAASSTADLLVVGTRGLGGFKHLLLGSVAEQCIRHADCNVLVVRG